MTTRTYSRRAASAYFPIAFCVVAVLALPFGARAAAASATPPVVTPTPWQIYQIFHESCAKCHGGHLTKPKGKFGYVLDLQRLIEQDYVKPGDPDHSDLFGKLVSTDEDEKMPPPDSDGHKPTDAEIATIRAWIAGGAPTGALPAEMAASDAKPGDRAGKSRPLLQTLGRLHPLLVHFPIALLLGACVAEVASRLRPAHAGWLQGTTRGSLWLAAFGATLAAACGWFNAAYEGYASGETDTHRWLGLATAALAVVSLVASEVAERARARDVTTSSRTVLLALLIAAVVLVVLAGHTGGELAFGQDYLTW